MQLRQRHAHQTQPKGATEIRPADGFLHNHCSNSKSYTTGFFLTTSTVDYHFLTEKYFSYHVLPFVLTLWEASTRNKEGSNNLLKLPKTLVIPHVEYCLSVWNPHYSKDKVLLEKVQHRYTKMILGMQDKTYEDRLKCLTLEERRNRQDLIEVFKMFKGFSSVSLHELFRMDENIKGTRGHICRLLKTRCTRDIAKYFFSNKVISRWNLLDQRTVDAPSINAFKSRLVCVRDSRMGFFMD